MKKKISIQLASWGLVYFFWIMVFQKREFTFSRTVTIEFCYLIFVAANYYLNILYNIPKFLYQKKYAPFLFVFCSGILITALLRVPLAMFLNEFYFLKSRVQPSFTTVLSSSFLNIFIWTIIIVSGKLMIDRFTFQQYVDEVKKQKEQAELDFLNAQFNPHFLFNSINSIYGHIDKHNPTARHMLLTFSDMLRYQLYDCSSNSIPIEKEIQYIRNYVELQKTRKEDGLSVELQVEENVKNISIAPLVFIAFIENSFKYVGVNGNGENKISISFSNHGKELQFKCINSKGALMVNHLDHKGIGISNAKRRLALIYPQKNELAIFDSDLNYEVSLAIQTI